MLSGQFISGNFNLLKGLRVAFPDTNAALAPKGETSLPVGGPAPSPLTPPADRDPNGGFKNAKITDLLYAEHHFQRGIIESLLFMKDDPTGTLRATDGNILGSFPQFTTFNNNDQLRDPNYNTSNADADLNRPMQVAGYLLGNTLDRYGKAVVGVAEKLWKGAYADRDRNPDTENTEDPPSRPHERKEMLNAAMGHLRKHAHFQYLASLPLAASFSDTPGAAGASDFEFTRINEASTMVDAAEGFIDRIRRGEIPKLDAFNLNASKSDINRKIADIVGPGGTRERARNTFADADQKIWRENDAEDQITSRRQQLRSEFTSQLRRLTSIDPGVESSPPYFGLATDSDRAKYRTDVYSRIDTLLAATDTDLILTTSGQIGKDMISVRAAQANIRSARNVVDAIPQQIKLLEEKVQAINGIILGTEEQVSAYRFAIAMAQAYKTSITAGVEWPIGEKPRLIATATFTYDPGAIPAARLQNQIGRAEALKSIAINNAEVREQVRALLIQQNQAALQLDESIILGQRSIADVNSTLAEIDGLIGDHKYFQQGNQRLWFSDAALTFDREAAEIAHEEALDSYKRNLYELSQMLAARWAEPFENPYFNRNRFGRSLPVAYDAFTQAESLFSTTTVNEADTFYGALKEWDSKLRDERDGGVNSRDITLSLRQDILGYTDLVWNGNALVINPSQTVLQNNKRAFRAWLLNRASPGGNFRLRVDFATTFAQPGLQQQAAPDTDHTIFKTADFEWNHRIISMKAKVIGTNPGGSTDGVTLPLQLYQFGRVEVSRYFPRTGGKLLYNLDLPLYYTDPEVASNSPYQFALNAGLGQSSNPVSPPNIIDDVEPSPFCNKWVLLISSQNTLPLNLANWDDIQFIFTVQSGQPPAFAW